MKQGVLVTSGVNTFKYRQSSSPTTSYEPWLYWMHGLAGLLAFQNPAQGFNGCGGYIRYIEKNARF